MAVVRVGGYYLAHILLGGFARIATPLIANHLASVVHPPARTLPVDLFPNPQPAVDGDVIYSGELLPVATLPAALPNLTCPSLPFIQELCPLAPEDERSTLPPTCPPLWPIQAMRSLDKPFVFAALCFSVWPIEAASPIGYLPDSALTAAPMLDSSPTIEPATSSIFSQIGPLAFEAFLLVLVMVLSFEIFWWRLDDYSSEKIDDQAAVKSLEAYPLEQVKENVECKPTEEVTELFTRKALDAPSKKVLDAPMQDHSVAMRLVGQSDKSSENQRVEKELGTSAVDDASEDVPPYPDYARRRPSHFANRRTSLRGPILQNDAVQSAFARCVRQRTYSADTVPTHPQASNMASAPKLAYIPPFKRNPLGNVANGKALRRFPSTQFVGTGQPPSLRHKSSAPDVNLEKGFTWAHRHRRETSTPVPSGRV
ncbi:hypothetical protein C8F01DRAFT_1347733 [Mycena amicta]|nr:hypothetical protein C8F01DRAFT_1347733 [Mycena amicta]